MAWKLYKSTDASAPVLTGEVGTLITVLDAVLVNGYGAQTAAGWTKDFAGTNKAAYRMGSGLLRAYARVNDNDPGAGGGGQEAGIEMYESMSDIDTGVDKIPLATYTPIRKSDVGTSAARPWFIVGDDRTFILLISYQPSVFYSGTYAGEFFSFVPGDLFGVCLIGRHTANSGTTTHETIGAANSSQGHWMLRDSVGVAKALAFLKSISIPGFPDNGCPFTAGWAFPHPIDGALLLGACYLSNTEASGVLIRGRLRGLYCPGHTYSALSGMVAGDTVQGTGSLSGKTFMFAGQLYGWNAAGSGFVEISDTVPRN